MNMKVREVQRKIQFQTASGELLEHHGEKNVLYMAQDSVVEITYQVTDVEGPVAAVSSMNDVNNQLNKLNRLLAIPRLRRRDREYQHLQIPLCKTTKTPQLQEHENLHLDPLLKNWTNMNSRTLCFVPGATLYFQPC